MMARLTVALMAAGLLATVPRAQQKVNQSGQILAEFDRRVAEYLKVQKSVRSEVHNLKPTNSQEKIESHEHELAHGIRRARRDARQGDLFTAEIAGEFRRLIAETMHGPEAARIRESLQSAAPVAARRIEVNGSYPPATPLQSAPPTLLRNLPVLPQGLEYGVVGQTLILRDVEANLIVDFIPNVMA